MADSDNYRFCQHDLVYHTVNGENVQLLVLGESGCYPGHLTCITTIDYPAFMRLMRKIRDECQFLIHDPVFTPEKTEICLVNVNTFGFIRCKCLDVWDDLDGRRLVNMYSVDYGVEFIIEAENVRAMPFWFSTVPVLALHVTGFTHEQALQCIHENECVASQLVAHVYARGITVHQIKMD